jgi:hypothetical protein
MARADRVCRALLQTADLQPAEPHTSRKTEDEEN